MYHQKNGKIIENQIISTETVTATVISDADKLSILIGRPDDLSTSITTVV